MPLFGPILGDFGATFEGINGSARGRIRRHSGAWRGGPGRRSPEEGIKVIGRIWALNKGRGALFRRLGA